MMGCAVFTGESGVEAERSTIGQMVQHYQAVQQSNVVLQPSDAANKDKRPDSGEKYYSNGTPAERYWGSLGSENNGKRQNVSALLQTIFPDGLGPLASKVAKIERKEQAKAARQAARQAANVRHGAADEADEVYSSAEFVTDHATGITTRTNSPAAVATAVSSSGRQDDSASTAAAQQTASLCRGAQSRTLTLSEGEGMCVSPSDAQARNSEVASRSSTAFGDRRTVSDAASAIFKTSAKPCHRHYTRGQKLAATILWEAASGKSQQVRLRQCLTYSEIRMKNLAAAAAVPVSHVDGQEPAAHRVAQEV